ncbi:hypothetical protein [Roseateles sp.]|uniref:hypothetical protein n=1 Tax=Roseateles sp. TaxID=1971397 RepID=UPI0025DED5A2|nr:hypothetical protein [Roseateles sp.]MBV8037826.1 hypothetical protein [Roseateles sp.]
MALIRWAALATAFALTGCASVINETTHPMRVETKASTGELVSGAECKLTNDYGTVSGKSGDTIQVRRSGKDLDITCAHPSNPNATARAISRANSGMWGNIIIGGGIGAIIDHNKGTAYTYPTWVQLVFGKSLVFDRSAEKDGQPTPSTETGTTVAAAAPATAASAAIVK